MPHAFIDNCERKDAGRFFSFPMLASISVGQLIHDHCKDVKIIASPIHPNMSAMPWLVASSVGTFQDSMSLHFHV